MGVSPPDDGRSIRPFQPVGGLDLEVLAVGLDDDGGGVSFGPERAIFDGRTLAGWRAVPRTPVPNWPGGPFPPEITPDYTAQALATTGRWEVVDGAIVGGQEPPGSGLGAYLVSEEAFSDFELRFDVRPDWPADTGVLVRATDIGAQGLQILIDHRRSGGIGGFYGNGVGSFHGVAFGIDATYDEAGQPVGLILDDPATSAEPVTDDKRAILSYAASPADFLAAWRWGDWNSFTVRCVGQYARLTSWINGVKMYELDTSTMTWPSYDREAVAALLGRRGHIALEVHHNDPGLGPGRWGAGAVVRWRNITVRELI